VETNRRLHVRECFFVRVTFTDDHAAHSNWIRHIPVFVFSTTILMRLMSKRVSYFLSRIGR
jgi:hypothetical protein